MIAVPRLMPDDAQVTAMCLPGSHPDHVGAITFKVNELAGPPPVRIVVS